jgi:hypothetical protein
MTVKQRANFYLNRDQLDAVRSIASTEDRKVSDLVRESIALLIADRMNNPRPDPAAQQERLQAFLTRYAGTAPRSDEEIDDVISSAASARTPVSEDIT